LGGELGEHVFQQKNCLFYEIRKLKEDFFYKKDLSIEALVALHELLAT
jgi:hypothetical protein